MKILVTGSTGFAGKRFVQTVLQDTDWDVVCLDRSLGKEEPRVHRVYHDLRAEFPTWLLKELSDVDVIVHFGAAVQAAKSLQDPQLYVETNAVGTFNLLEAARKIHVSKFLYISSGEVVGVAQEPTYTPEGAPLHPVSPYGAGKAAGELLCNAWRKSFNLPITIVRTLNLFGEGQQLDKFVPLVIDRLTHGEQISILVNEWGKPAVRQWLHVDVFIDALFFLIRLGADPKIIHIAGFEADTVELTERIADILKIPSNIVVKIQTDASNRYALAGDLIQSHGWETPQEFTSNLDKTVLAVEEQVWQRKFS